MCKHGDTIVLNLPGRKQFGPVEVDRCIAPLVQALNEAGFYTASSCCGHGNRPGIITLRDAREIVIMPDWEAARKIDHLFPNIHGEHK